MRAGDRWLTFLAGALIVGCSSPNPGGVVNEGADGGADTLAGDGEARAETGSRAPDGAASRDSSRDGAGSRQSDGAASSDASREEAGSRVSDGGESTDSAHADAGLRDSEAGVDAPPPTPATCPRSVSWGSGVELSISTSGDDTFGAITPDELTIAWTTGTTSVTVNYADRSDAADEFGIVQMVPAAPGYFAVGQVALSADGLRLAVLSSDATTMAVIVRTARGAPFDTAPAPGEFSELDTNVAAGESAAHLGDPVFGASDDTFYYSIYGSGRQGTVFETTRLTTGSPWPVGTALAAGPLLASGTERRHPTGIASDDLTLFFWDDFSGSEKMAWRATVSDAFSQVTDIGQRAGAQPNAACTAIYYSAAGESGLALFVAEAE